ncbi:MAG: hypothetical protein WAN03_12280 [Candidatus Sulfotelmatobacter sp.]
MRSKLMLCAVLALASAAYAKDPKMYQTGTLVQMNSVQCGSSEKDGNSKKTQDLLCQEYVVESERVNYRIRPRDEKHPALLPVGERAQFRIEQDKMLLRMEDTNKEHKYTVVSMTPRTDSSAADATPARVNHLQ